MKNKVFIGFSGIMLILLFSCFFFGLAQATPIPPRPAVSYDPPPAEFGDPVHITVTATGITLQGLTLFVDEESLGSQNCPDPVECTASWTKTFEGLASEVGTHEVRVSIRYLDAGNLAGVSYGGYYFEYSSFGTYPEGFDPPHVPDPQLRYHPDPGIVGESVGIEFFCYDKRDEEGERKQTITHLILYVEGELQGIYDCSEHLKFINDAFYCWPPIITKAFNEEGHKSVCIQAIWDDAYVSSQLLSKCSGVEIVAPPPGEEPPPGEKPPANGKGWGPPIELKNPFKGGSPEELVENIINFLFWFAIVLAPLLFLIAGLLYITSGGDPNRVRTARNLVIYPLIGLAIILLAKGLIALMKQVLS